MRLYCESDDRMRLAFIRDAEWPGGSAATVSLASGSDKPIVLTKTPWSNTVLGWVAVVSSDAMKALLATSQFQIAELTGPNDKPTERKFELETLGLEDALAKLYAACKPVTAAAQPQ